MSQVVPYVGVCTAILIFLAPMNDVKELQNSSVTSLLSMNPLPYPMAFNNALGWILYGLISKDSFVFVPNAIGLILSLYYSITAYAVYHKIAPAASSMNPLSKISKSTQIQLVWLSGTVSAWFGAYLAFIAFADHSLEERKNIIGYVCVALLVMFYTSPLATFKQVIETRDASSFSYPLSLACLLNGLVWCYYGWFVVLDAFIWAPNLVGVLVSVLQIVLKLAFANARVPSGNSYEFL
ncbi:hypothetical protein MP638_000098 [Amoeboaphelidium occidentale]|nr:hypothetical protein MP638_000098 [Amoeboaphelidium occidentale]